MRYSKARSNDSLNVYAGDQAQKRAKKGAALFKHEYIWFALFIYTPLIVDLYRRISEVLNFEPNVAILFKGAIYALSALYVFAHALLSKRLKQALVMSIIYLVLVSISFAITPRIRMVLGEAAVLFFARMIWAFYIGYYSRDRMKLVRALCGLSWVPLIYAGSVMFFSLPGQASNTDIGNYMSIANELLIPALANMYAVVFLKENRFRNFCYASFMILVIVIYGSRGSVGAIALSAVVLLAFALKRIDARIGSLCVLGCALLVSIAMVAAPSGIGISAGMFDSRNIETFLSGEFFKSDARFDGYIYLLNVVLEHPLALYGLFADRIYYGDVYGALYTNMHPASSIVVDYSGTYAHNFPLEILVQFGLILGSVVIVLVTVALIKFFRQVARSADPPTLVLTGCFVVSFLVPLSISMSYLISYQFWLAAGFVAAVLMQKPPRANLDDSPDEQEISHDRIPLYQQRGQNCV